MHFFTLPTDDAAVLAGALLVALVLDWLFGEPPARLHPVVAMGQYLAAAARRVAPAVGAAARPMAAFWGGALGWCVGATLVVALACAALLAIQGLHPWAQTALLGVLLKPMLSWRMLRDEVRAVETALAESLDAGRARVGWLVSRDVATLSEAQVRAAALSTLAENLNDSVVAPLFWFAVAGLPGAALYRFANTADAMWGYRGARDGRDWTWAGKWAARADDVLSWLPARLTGCVLALVGGGRFAQLPREAAKTPSPNSGWPMAALALALGVCLRKSGIYALNADGVAPRAADTARALAMAAKVVGVAFALAVLALVAQVLPAGARS